MSAAANPPANDQPMCCICGQPCEPWVLNPDGTPAPETGWGHNPDPYGTEGDRACRECNQTHVIPARITNIQNRNN